MKNYRGMGMFSGLLLMGLLVLALPGVALDRSEQYYTILQTATGYHPKSNIQVDLALVAAAESEQDIQMIPEKVQSWRERGYRVYGFASIARVYDYYMKGGWLDLDGNRDEGGHEGEIQRNRFGGKFGPHEYMMMPSLRLMEHKKLWAKAFIDSEVEGMVYEEPDIFIDGGYGDSFKQEWKEYYGEPWQAPHSSIENRVKSERLKSYIGYRSYKILSEYCREQGGEDFRFALATHSLPNYMLWGISFNYYDTLSLPTVDILQAQIWTGTAKSPLLYEGSMREMLFANAYVDYSYSANLVEALGKEVWFNLDPYEDEPGLSFDFYKAGFRNTLIASLMFPDVNKWEILPWPSRIYLNDRIPPDYGTELQNVLTAMHDVGAAEDHDWHKEFPRTGILFSESALLEMRDPQPSNPQGLFCLALPLLSMGIPVDIVPLEAVVHREYLRKFRVLYLSYDFYKPLQKDLHTALSRWVKEDGGVLVIVGGKSAYNQAPLWWREEGHDSPVSHLLHELGLGQSPIQLIPQQLSDLHTSESEQSGIQRYQSILGDLCQGLQGANFIAYPVSFAPNDTFPEMNYLHTVIGPGYVVSDRSLSDGERTDIRFADGPGFITYKFRTKGLKTLQLHVDIAQNYVVEASNDDVEWVELTNSISRIGREVRDMSSREVLKLELSPFLKSDREFVYVRFRDPSPDDGWGPLLIRLSLLPEYQEGYAPSMELAPLNTRDAYCIGYKGLSHNLETILAGKDGIPVIFRSQAGKGEVFGVGISPVLFGSSRERAERLRQFNQELAVQHRMNLDADGVFHLRRGDAHILFPFSNSSKLEGTFLDMLSSTLDVLKSPTLQQGVPYLLKDISPAMREAMPSILFASHRLRESHVSDDQVDFTIEGPERIPAVASLFLGGRNLEAMTLHRVKDESAVEPISSLVQDGTLLIHFPNLEGGVRVSVRLKESLN